MTRTPITVWETNEKESYYIDLGSVENVNKIYFLVKVGSADATVYLGSPGNWRYNGLLKIPRFLAYSYYRWNEYILNSKTRYIRFDFQQASVQIAEMAVLNAESQRLQFKIINDEIIDSNLFNLNDEQDLVEIPPTYMTQTHFDEIYFVRTAENYLKLQIPYSWSHPPLGKLIIASGILAFGYSPFGWRILGVVFATLLIPVIYILGKQLMNTWIGAFASAFLFAFDFLNFSMGRMATTDVYVTFFSLVSQLFFLIYIKGFFMNGWKTSVTPLFLAVLFFSFAFSTKWIAIFGFLGQLSILLILRLKDLINQKNEKPIEIKHFFRHPFFILIIFILLAVGIYFLTYIPNMLAGQSLENIFQLQLSMFNYHSLLNSTHPYASKWFTWPFIIKPVLLLRSYLPNNIISLIMALGNPAVWWVGFSSILLSIKYATKKDFICIFIAVFFFFQWLPYIFISRTTYLYHFYSNVPFLCLATSYFISKYWSNKWGKVIAFTYFVTVIILFIAFYPIISGMPTHISSIDNLIWLESWKVY